MSFDQGLTILFIIAILILAMGFTLLQFSLDSMDENHESKEGSDECQKKN